MVQQNLNQILKLIFPRYYTAVNEDFRKRLTTDAVRLLILKIIECQRNLFSIFKINKDFIKANEVN